MATNELIEPTEDANDRTGGDAKTNTSCQARGVTCSLTRSQHSVIYGPSEGVAVLDAPESILPHVIDMLCRICLPSRHEPAQLCSEAILATLSPAAFGWRSHTGDGTEEGLWG